MKQIILVTGASSGFGRLAADALAQAAITRVVETPFGRANAASI